MHLLLSLLWGLLPWLCPWVPLDHREALRWNSVNTNTDPSCGNRISDESNDEMHFAESKHNCGIAFLPTSVLSLLFTQTTAHQQVKVQY